MITPEQLAKSGSESAHQKALFCWAALPGIRLRWPELESMFAIPNGGTRNKIEAANLKAQGVKPGVPDIMLPVTRGDLHGLWIEMKVGKNKPSEDQLRYQRYLRDCGYVAEICYSWIEATEVIVSYLRL